MNPSRFVCKFEIQYSCFYFFCLFVYLFHQVITSLSIKDVTFAISVFLSFCVSVFQCFCLSVFLSFCLSVFLSFCLSVFLSFCLSFVLYFCLSVFLTLCLSVFPSFDLGLLSNLKIWHKKCNFSLIISSSILVFYCFHMMRYFEVFVGRCPPPPFLFLLYCSSMCKWPPVNTAKFGGGGAKGDWYTLV